MNAPARQQQSNKAAKVLYQPVGIASSIVAGVVAGQVFKLVWRRALPGDRQDTPDALESEYSLQEVLLGAVVQGAIFAAVKAAVSRGGARAFERWTGQWPGN